MRLGETWVRPPAALVLGEGLGNWAASPLPQDPGRFWLDSLCSVEPPALRSIPLPALSKRVGVRAGMLGDGALECWGVGLTLSPCRLERRRLGVGEAKCSRVCVCPHQTPPALLVWKKKIQMNRFLPPATHSESRSVRKVDGSPKQRGSEMAEFLAYYDCVCLCIRWL